MSDNQVQRQNNLSNETQPKIKIIGNTKITDRSVATSLENNQQHNNTILYANTNSPINNNELDNNLTQTSSLSSQNSFGPHDNSVRGHSCMRKKIDDFRLVFQNINGLRTHTMDKWKATLETIEIMQADSIGLCETCVDWNSNKLTNAFKKYLHKKI
jgi:hypothetical protein